MAPEETAWDWEHPGTGRSPPGQGVVSGLVAAEGGGEEAGLRARTMAEGRNPEDTGSRKIHCASG